jgi:hypothetical protein
MSHTCVIMRTLILPPPPLEVCFQRFPDDGDLGRAARERELP